MADVRESFPTLEDGSQVGVPLSKKAEGDAIAGGNYTGTLIAKRAGNWRIPVVNAQDELVVDTESAEVACLHDYGTNAGSATFVDLATITLVLERQYQKVGWAISCFRDAIYEVVYIDDVGGTPTETVLAVLRVGPGDFQDSSEIHCHSFSTVGGTGVQNLVLRAKNLNALSTLDGSLSVEETQ